jgi:hypothetical protein
METSLVSIPSNVDGSVLRIYEKEFDALCTAYSRNELKHDAVKHWAKAISDKRPVQVQGVTLKDEKQVNKDTGGGELPKELPEKCSACGEAKLDLTGTCQACGHVKEGKAAPELRQDGQYSRNVQRLGPLTMEARAYGLERVLDIQQRAQVDLVNAEEEARIHELIALNTWPNKWDGTEVTGDAMLDAMTVNALGEIVSQPLLS